MLEGSILQQLMGDRDRHDRPMLNFGVYYKNTLVALCHALEDCILATQCQPLVITAFQQGKWYLQEADRYGAIADNAEQIVIMAAPDTGFHSHPTSQRSNVALIDLDPNDPVAQEWHLIILSPQYTAMVLCQELSPADYGPQGIPQNDLERKFYGFWTFDPDLVRATATCALQHVRRYQPELETQLSATMASILAANPSLSETGSHQTVGEAVTRVLDYLQHSEDQVKGSTTFQGSDDLTHNLTSNELQAFLRMAQLVDLMDPLNPQAAVEVTALLEMMAQVIDLPAWRVKRLRLAGWLHRIAPLQAEVAGTDQAPSCPLVPGAQVLRRMSQLRAVAQIITHQTEHWDGSGQPAGLVGDQIPLESRMLGLAAYFQAQVVARSRQGSADPLGDCLAQCESAQGKRWDPKLVEILSLVVRGLQQGLSLPNIPMRVTLGAGLLDPAVVGWDSESDASRSPARQEG